MDKQLCQVVKRTGGFQHPRFRDAVSAEPQANDAGYTESRSSTLPGRSILLPVSAELSVHAGSSWHWWSRSRGFTSGSQFFSECQSQAHRSESTGQAAGQAARLRTAKEGQNSNASILIGSCHGVTVAIISHRTEAVPPVPKFSLHTCSQHCSCVRRIAIRGYGWHPGEGTISSRP